MESVGRRSPLVVNVLASFSGLDETLTALAVVYECDDGVASLVTNAFAIVRDTIGEKPVETYEDLTPHSPIILGLVAEELVAAAQAEHAKRSTNRSPEGSASTIRMAILLLLPW